MVKSNTMSASEIRRAAVHRALKQNKGDFAVAAAVTQESVRYVTEASERYNTLKTFKDRPRSGRPKALSKQQIDAAAVLLAELNNAAAVTRILVEQHGARPSLASTTVMRSMKGVMEAAKPEKQPLLTNRNMEKRVAFAKQLQHHGPDSDIITSIDSAYFTMNTHNPNGKVWTKCGVKPRRFKPNKSQQLHVYGGISVHGKTPLFYVSGTTGVKKKYMNSKGTKKLNGVGGEEFKELLLEQLAPAAQQLFDQAGAGKTTLLLDNAPGHTAAGVQKAIRDNNISVVPNWPANSPDLNPIENIWGMMKLEVYRKQYNTFDEFKAAVEAAWQRIPVTTLQNCMRSMPRRIAKVIKLKGRYIGY